MLAVDKLQIKNIVYIKIIYIYNDVYDILSKK